MQLKPLVSVIIPTYNAQEFITETLESVFAQTYPNIEIIVVDDGSTDQTSSIVRGYQSKICYYNQSNSGGSSIPRNAGIAYSSGEFLCFIDSDDLIVPDQIETQVNFMEHYSEVGLVFSNYQNFNNHNDYLKSNFESCPHFYEYIKGKNEIVIEKAYRYLARENFGIASSFLMRKSLLEFEPCFDPSLRSSEDFNFYYRLSRHTKVGIINKVGMMRRIHENNKSSKAIFIHDRIRSYTMLRDGETDTLSRHYLNKFIASFWSSLSRYNANRRKPFLALLQEVRALFTDFCAARAYMLCKSILRIFAIKIGLHKPSEE